MLCDSDSNQYELETVNRELTRKLTRKTQLMFSHEKLAVYQKALTCVAKLETVLDEWKRKHAVRDELQRALESVIVNIAGGCRAHSPEMKLTCADYSLGSVLECAACIDIAFLKNLLVDDEALRHKKALQEIARMMVGLRKAWGNAQVQEDSAEYSANSVDSKEPLFLHETFDVCLAAYAFARWFYADGFLDRMSIRQFRRIDEPCTAMLLNIAEGKGRFVRLDKANFCCNSCGCASGCLLRATGRGV